MCIPFHCFFFQVFQKISLCKNQRRKSATCRCLFSFSSSSSAALVIVSCKFVAAVSPHDLFLLLVQVGSEGGCPNLWVCRFDDHGSLMILPAGIVAPMFAFLFLMCGCSSCCCISSVLLQLFLIAATRP